MIDWFTHAEDGERYVFNASVSDVNRVASILRMTLYRVIKNRNMNVRASIRCFQNAIIIERRAASENA